MVLPKVVILDVVANAAKKSRIIYFRIKQMNSYILIVPVVGDGVLLESVVIGTKYKKNNYITAWAHLLWQIIF